MHEPHRKIAIIGEQQDSARRVVETTNRNETPRHTFDERGDGNSPFRIVSGTNGAARFVQEHVHEGLGDDSLAVQLDLLTPQICLRSKFGNDLAVDANTPGYNELFCLTPSRNAGACQDFLQSVSHGGRSWQTFTPNAARHADSNLEPGSHFDQGAGEHLELSLGS